VPEVTPASRLPAPAAPRLPALVAPALEFGLRALSGNEEPGMFFKIQLPTKLSIKSNQYQADILFLLTCTRTRCLSCREKERVCE